VTVLAVEPRVARAQDTERVPLRESFSTGELAVTAAAAGGWLFLFAAGNSVFGAPHPSLGPPDRDSLDARLSRDLYRGDGAGRFLWRLPDVVGGYVLPFIPVAVYGAGALSLAVRGQPLWPRHDWNADHRVLAYVEALSWTYVVTGAVKYSVGRARPYTALANNHPQLRGSPSEDNLSFFSGHSSGAFVAGAFVAADASRYLRRWVLADQGPVVRFLVGTLLPYTVGYGVPALVGVSRVIDQQHWPSDVAMGALTGVLIGNLVYAAHFDDEGRPRRRTDGRLVPVTARRPDGSALVSVAYVGRF
jgi:membrane-associated phospholipid phosphatase